MACSNELPPYGQVLLIVDTDLPAPELAGRLRIDTYDEAGTWTDSLDRALPQPGSFPTTFTVLSTDVAQPRKVLVRLRAYPEGGTRDYLGERFAAKPVWAPKAPSTWD